MNKIATQENLIRYAYNETRLFEADQVQRAIDGDPLIREEYQEITEVLNKLSEVKLEPSDTCIAGILAKAWTSVPCWDTKMKKERNKAALFSL